MDKERIVGISTHWNELKDVFRKMGIPVSRRNAVIEHISHGVMVICGNEGLFLQMVNTYEYQSIVTGEYSGAKLYHFLSLITQHERRLLLEVEPTIQWSMLFGLFPMPEAIHRKLTDLQQCLRELYTLIPSAHEDDDPLASRYLLTIPKGRANKGESSKAAALRELQEETGICLSEDKLVDICIDRSTGTDGNIYTTYTYAAFIEEHPRITLSKEFKGYIWLNMSDGQFLLKRQMKILSNFIAHRNEHVCFVPPETGDKHIKPDTAAITIFPEYQPSDTH